MPKVSEEIKVENGRASISMGHCDTIGSHTQNASLNTVQSITVPALAGVVLMQATTQNVRYTLDGTTPTTSKGFVLKAGEEPQLVPVEPGNTIKAIEETASAKLDYQFLE